MLRHSSEEVAARVVGHESNGRAGKPILNGMHKTIELFET